MRKQLARTLIALAVTLPMTFMAAGAQSNDDDIAAYAHELDFRIEQGRSSLSQSNYDNLRNLWNKIEQIRRQYTGRRMGDAERNSMMASLTTLDRELTNNLHDDQNARFQNWDPAKRSWRQNWWSNATNPNPNLYNYNDEIVSYQRQLKQRLDNARSSGRLSPANWSQLNASYNRIDQAQQDYRRAGFSYSERNNLMNMLTQLDRDMTSQLRDNENSRFSFWDPNQRSWNQKWWQSGWSNNRPHNSTQLDNASANFNEEIDAYQRDLKQRLDRARSQGRISPAEMNKLTAQYNEIDQKQQSYRPGGFNFFERNTLMGSLTQLDRDISAAARNDDDSHYRHWDSQNNRWNNSWWRNQNQTPVATSPTDTMGNNDGFSEEVNKYQTRLRSEMNRGQRNGQLTANEAAEIQREFDAIEQLQNQARQRGYNRGERDSIMNRLRALDTKLSASLANADTTQSAREARDQWKQERRDDRGSDRRNDRWNTTNNVAPPTQPATTAPAATNQTTPPATTDDNSDDGRRRRGRGKQRGND